MSNSTIFGFSIEESDGKLVITLDGSVATGVADRLRQQIAAGRGADLLRYFTPLRGLRRLVLSSPPVKIAATPEPGRATDEINQLVVDPLPIERVFNQGFEGGLDGFEKQLSEFEASLGVIEQEITASAEAAPAKKAKKA